MTIKNNNNDCNGNILALNEHIRIREDFVMQTIDDLYDRYLNIYTAPDDDKSVERSIYVEYQPSDYSFLEYLFTQYPFKEGDCFVDFGAGKGRVLVMAANYMCNDIVGYEVDKSRSQILEKNIQCFMNKYGLDFKYAIYGIDAQHAAITDKMNKFFFFNPFHLRVYIHILNKIKASIRRCKRPVYIFLYAPNTSIVNYIDSLVDFCKIEFKRSYREFNHNVSDYYEYVVYKTK